MAFESTNIEINNKVDQVRFGSEVAFRTASTKNYFIYSDGYIDSGLICLNISQAEEHQISFGRLYVTKTSKSQYSPLCLSKAPGILGT